MQHALFKPTDKIIQYASKLLRPALANPYNYFMHIQHTIIHTIHTVQLDLNLSKNHVWCCTHTQYVQFQPHLALRVHAKLLTRILLAGTSRVSTRVPDVPSRACIIEYLKRMQHESTCARELSL